MPVRESMIGACAYCILKSFMCLIKTFILSLNKILNGFCELRHLARGQVLAHESLYELIPRMDALGWDAVEPQLRSSTECKLNEIQSDDILRDISLMNGVANGFELGDEAVWVFMRKTTERMVGSKVDM